MADAPHKACSRCGIDQDLQKFSPDKRASDGRQSCCKKCVNAQRRERRTARIEEFREKERAYYLANKVRVHANNKKSRARHPQKIKEAKKAWYEKAKHRLEYQARIKARQEANKDAKREYDRQYRARTAEKQKEWSQNWIERNPEKRAAISQNYKAKRRAQETGGITSVELLDWKKAQPKVCYWCSAKCAKNFHVDHYIPLAKGGKHEAQNLVISCAGCNLKKNAKDPLDFAKEVGRLL